MPLYEKLFVKAKGFILSLSQTTCLTSFYVGKSGNVELRRTQHQEEGYYQSIEIAKSTSPKKIDEAERYLISKFEQEDLPVKFANEIGGGGGNPKANKLYIALCFDIKDIDELDDVDEDNLIFESIEL